MTLYGQGKLWYVNLRLLNDLKWIFPGNSRENGKIKNSGQIKFLIIISVNNAKHSSLHVLSFRGSRSWRLNYRYTLATISDRIGQRLNYIENLTLRRLKFSFHPVVNNRNNWLLSPFLLQQFFQFKQLQFEKQKQK